MEYFLSISLSYLCGSIPFGLILTNLFSNKDIRKIGSGNIGATNVLRTGNKFLGYGTLILDILKAIIPIIYIKYKKYISNIQLIITIPQAQTILSKYILLDQEMVYLYVSASIQMTTLLIYLAQVAVYVVGGRMPFHLQVV